MQPDLHSPFVRPELVVRLGFLSLVLSLLVAGAFLRAGISPADPLSSWNDTNSKRTIIDFVERVTRADSVDFVPVPERIAVFDNDGTLWPENPVPFEVAFVSYEINRQLPEHPDWNNDPAVRAFRAGDLAALVADDHKGLLRIAALTHVGLTTDEFAQHVAGWLKSDRNPRFGRSYTDCIYQPMLEVLIYLRAHGFQTWIVSGGGKDFMRVWSEKVYGIPPERVIGSYGEVKFEMRNGRPRLLKTLDTVFVNDREGKPAAIQQFIGRRPIAAFGNSDGDQAMLEYTTVGNPLASFGLIVHHTDAKREYEYDAKPRSTGKLVAALAEAGQRNWTIVDMKMDWKTVLPARVR